MNGGVRMDNNWFHGESEESQRMLRTFDYLYEFIEEHSENPEYDILLLEELCALINGRRMTKRGALILKRMLQRDFLRKCPICKNRKVPCLCHLWFNPYEYLWTVKVKDVEE
jgi:hypothetical protein